MADEIITQFDPTDHTVDLYDAFNEFVANFHYKYQSWTKEPPTGVETEEAKKNWHQANKRKYFLGRFSSRNLQRDFEDLVPEGDRDTITFNDMINRFRERYQPTKNSTIRNFQFHALRQEEGKAFDTFVNRVKHEAAACDFKCNNAGCTVPDILARDIIIIGTNNPDIQKNALKEQWNLKDLVTNGRLIQAATAGAERLNLETQQVSRVGKSGGKYSKKKALRRKQDEEKSKESPKKCPNCNHKNCIGGKKCWAFDKKCYACGLSGHIKGSTVCRGPNKKEARRLEDERKSKSNYSDTDSDSETYETADSEQSEEDRKFSKSRIGKSAKCKFVAGIRRTQQNGNYKGK